MVLMQELIKTILIESSIRAVQTCKESKCDFPSNGCDEENDKSGVTESSSKNSVITVQSEHVEDVLSQLVSNLH